MIGERERGILDQFAVQISTLGTLGMALEHVESGTSWDYNADETFYAASIIKIPIMAAVFDQASRGNFRLQQKFPIEAEDMVTGSGILQNLTPGIEMSIYDVMVLMIIESDNTATNLLADLVGVDSIQSAMMEWGLEQSQFRHKLQIIPAKRSGGSNLVTAREMSRLMSVMAKGKLVSWNACRHMVSILKQQKFNDGIPSLLPVADTPVGAIPAWEFAHKTGFVAGIEHDVGLLYFPGHTFSVSFLSKDVTDRLAIKEAMGEFGKLLYDMARVN